MWKLCDNVDLMKSFEASKVSRKRDWGNSEWNVQSAGDAWSGEILEQVFEVPGKHEITHMLTRWGYEIIFQPGGNFFKCEIIYMWLWWGQEGIFQAGGNFFKPKFPHMKEKIPLWRTLQRWRHPNEHLRRYNLHTHTHKLVGSDGGKRVYIPSLCSVRLRSSSSYLLVGLREVFRFPRLKCSESTAIS